MNKLSLPESEPDLLAKFFWDYRGIGKPPGHLIPLEKMLGLQEKYLSQKIKTLQYAKSKLLEVVYNPYNFILFAEHAPIYSCPESKIDSLKDSNRLFKIDAVKKNSNKLPAKFYILIEKRGGSITYHGPGQLTCYLVLCLEELSLSIQQLPRIIDESLKELLASFNIKSYSIDELLDMPATIRSQAANSKLFEKPNSTSKETPIMSAQGVWVVENGEIRKIASRGIHIVNHTVTYSDGSQDKFHFTKFGFSLNVNTDLSYFDYIYPCGLDIKMTSLERLTGSNYILTRLARMIAKILISNFEKNLKATKKTPN